MIVNSKEYRHHKGLAPRHAGGIRNVRGFTLVELVLVISLVSIMIMIMVPSIRDWKSTMTVRKDSRDVLFAIKAARMKAITLSTAVTFTIDAVAKTYEVKDANGGVHVRGRIDPDISISKNTLGGSVQFDSKGMPSASGSVQMGNGKLTKTVMLYLTGMTKLM